MPGTPIYINNGVAQDERLPKELDPSQLRIDERNTIDLLSFMGDYAKLLNYYDGKSGKLEINGTWEFFTRKPLFYIARIAAHKTSDAKGRLTLSVLGNPGESLTNKIYALRLLFEIIVLRIRSMDDWIRNIDLLPEAYAMRLQTQARDVLAPQLITLQAYNNLFVHTYRLVPYDFFDIRKTPGAAAMARWGLDDENTRVHESMVELNKTFAPPTGSSTENPELYFKELIERNYLQIAVIYQSFDNSINYLINASLRLVEEEIARNHDTKPDMAMMLTFLKLFETAQESLNANTGKHLDFYYNRVLQLQPQPLQPDRVYVAIGLVPGSGTYVLPQGTRFDAGKDAAGNQLTYVSTTTTVLNQATAQSFFTQQVSRNPLVSTGLKPQWITGIYSSDHGNPMDTSEAPWALFGEDQLMFGEDQTTMRPVTPGFAFSSPVLFLSGGQRSIEVTLTFSSDSFQRSFMPALASVTNQRGGNNDSTFYALFENAFAVKASTASGWSPLSMQTLAYDETTCSIRFGLGANESVPPITACDSKVHGPSYQTPYPLLCFELQYGLPYYVYNFLKDLVIEKATIDVTVSGLKNMVLYNQYGPVDTSKPFQPFGVQPARGTFFMVGSRELFIKKTTGLVIDVSWQGLPDTDFKTYYANYNWDIDTSSFKVSGSYLKDYRWQTPGFRPMLENLYDTADGSQVPQSISTFAFGPLAEPITSNHMQPSDLALPLVYNNTTESGFVKLELVAPAEGFGANLYSNALSQVVLANAKDDEKIPLPNPPYTPVANGMTLSYTANDEINLLTPVPASNSVKPFYHIGAFTIYAAIPRNVSADTTMKTLTSPGPTYGNHLFLVPEFDAEGSLFIGLDQLTPPAPVSLWFQLQEKAVEQSMASPPTIYWSYLVNNVWVPFEAGNTIQDDTEGFVHSGVITFDLPAEISNTNTVMPQGLYWIRAQVNRSTNVFGNVLAIYAQVAELVYSFSSAPMQRDSLCLPASTISKTLDAVSQIKTIRQPFKSWGGRLSENGQEFRTRVSERLRHKQRASTAWDYERLVLEKYPVIYKAKCLTASTLAVLGPSEGMELVIIPGINSEGAVLAKDTIAPVFGFTMLEEVEQYLVGLSSAHARINVRNPVYEALRIRCSVCFDIDNPFYVQQLTNDINSFLSPWDNNNLNIGSGIQPSTILGYIQKLSYVKFVTGFSVIKVAFKEGKNYIFDTACNKSDESDMLYALTPWSVFVPFSTHLINVIDSERYISPQRTGIGMLSIGSDFVVKKTAPEEPAPESENKTEEMPAPTAEPPVPIQSTPLFRI